MKRILMIVSALAIPSIAAVGMGAQGSGQAGSGVDLSKAKLKTPSALTEKAPDTYKVKFDTSKGAIVIDVHRDWAPVGADRFYNLVKNGFYDDTRFFRVLDGFMAQIGINGNPAIQTAWKSATMQDDPVKQSNKRGFVTYAKSSLPNSRSTQIFINYRDNSSLDKQGFAPF